MEKTKLKRAPLSELPSVYRGLLYRLRSESFKNYSPLDFIQHYKCIVVDDTYYENTGDNKPQKLSDLIFYVKKDGTYDTLMYTHAEAIIRGTNVLQNRYGFWGTGKNNRVKVEEETYTFPGWLARDGEPAGGDLVLYSEEPYGPDLESPYEDDHYCWGVKGTNFADIITTIPTEKFPEVTFEGGPVEVEITVKIKK